MASPRERLPKRGSEGGVHDGILLLHYSVPYPTGGSEKGDWRHTAGRCLWTKAESRRMVLRGFPDSSTARQPPRTASRCPSSHLPVRGAFNDEKVNMRDDGGHAVEDDASVAFIDSERWHRSGEEQ